MTRPTRTTPTTPRTLAESAFRAHERFLWWLCYRMTGSAADADDLVQETFARVLARPPADLDAPLRPWLVQVAMNLARDQLRRRRHRAYTGPWLPSPVDTPAGPGELPDVHEPAQTAGRYDLLESVSLAFLLALEALRPRERAVLILRDVFDYSVADAAAALGLSEANVKTTHHRARRAMEAYDRGRCRPGRELALRTRQTLERLLAGLIAQDVPAVEAVLAADVRALSDGGGEFRAARVPVVGRAKVARFYLHLAARRAAGSRAEIRLVNALPAALVETAGSPTGDAPRFLMMLDLDDQGATRAIYTVLATAKLTAVAPLGRAGAG